MNNYIHESYISLFIYLYTYTYYKYVYTHVCDAFLSYTILTYHPPMSGNPGKTKKDVHLQHYSEETPGLEQTCKQMQLNL